MAVTVVTASRAQMFAMPAPKTIERVPASTPAAFVKSSRVPRPSPVQMAA